MLALPGWVVVVLNSYQEVPTGTQTAWLPSEVFAISSGEVALGRRGEKEGCSRSNKKENGESGEKEQHLWWLLPCGCSTVQSGGGRQGACSSLPLALLWRVLATRTRH